MRQSLGMKVNSQKIIYKKFFVNFMNKYSDKL